MPRGGNHLKTHTSEKNACRDYLRTNGAYVHSNVGALGMERGIPDIEGVLQGRFVAVEIKTGTGRLSLAQKQKQEDITRAGGCYFHVKDLEDLEMQMIEAEFRLIGLLLTRRKL